MLTRQRGLTLARPTATPTATSSLSLRVFFNTPLSVAGLPHAQRGAPRVTPRFITQSTTVRPVRLAPPAIGLTHRANARGATLTPWSSAWQATNSSFGYFSRHRLRHSIFKNGKPRMLGMTSAVAGCVAEVASLGMAKIFHCH